VNRCILRQNRRERLRLLEEIPHEINQNIGCLLRYKVSFAIGKIWLHLSISRKPKFSRTSHFRQGTSCKLLRCSIGDATFRNVKNVQFQARNYNRTDDEAIGVQALCRQTAILGCLPRARKFFDSVHCTGYEHFPQIVCVIRDYGINIQRRFSSRRIFRLSRSQLCRQFTRSSHTRRPSCRHNTGRRSNQGGFAWAKTTSARQTPYPVQIPVDFKLGHYRRCRPGSRTGRPCPPPDWYCCQIGRSGHRETEHPQTMALAATLRLPQVGSQAGKRLDHRLVRFTRVIRNIDNLVRIGIREQPN